MYNYYINNYTVFLSYTVFVLRNVMWYWVVYR